MHDAALVRESHVGTDQNVVRNRLSENFNAEHVGDYFFGFALEIGVDEGDVVI